MLAGAFKAVEWPAFTLRTLGTCHFQLASFLQTLKVSYHSTPTRATALAASSGTKEANVSAIKAKYTTTPVKSAAKKASWGTTIAPSFTKPSRIWSADSPTARY